MTEQTATALRKSKNRKPPPEDTSRPDVYVVRSADPSRRFGWEIRRMGAIVMERSRDDFTTAEQARADGAAALAALAATGWSEGLREAGADSGLPHPPAVEI